MIVMSQNDRRTRMGILIFDVLVTETVSFESQVTMYPVEDGAEISDHITEGNEKISLSGVISTADVAGGFGIAAAFGAGVDNSTKLIDVVEALRQMHKDRQLITVSTGQLVYEDRAFTSLTATRTADGAGGNWVSVNAELVKVKKVKLKTADVPAPETTLEPASGRVGETNKPAGRSTPSSTANNSANNYGPQRSGSDRSLLVSGEQAVQRSGGGLDTTVKNIVRGIYGPTP